MPTEINRTKIRLGLAIISAIFIGCGIGIFVVEDKLAKVVFLAVALVALVRLALLARGLRNDLKARQI